MYSTDNGAEVVSWPDGGTTPFRGEKNTNWEGGYRVPAVIRWPGVIQPGTIINEIFSHEDMIPTILAAAGVPDVKEQLLKGMKVGGKTFKVHLDGYNITDSLAGKGAESAPRVLLLHRRRLAASALRYDQWKIVFVEQRAHGFDVWQEPFVPLRVPKLFNIRADPFEHAEHSWDHYGGGGSTGCSCSFRRSSTSASSSPASRSSRRARRSAASRSTRCSRRSLLRRAATDAAASLKRFHLGSHPPLRRVRPLFSSGGST